jgi:hypothetical protein
MAYFGQQCKDTIVNFVLNYICMQKHGTGPSYGKISNEFNLVVLEDQYIS